MSHNNLWILDAGHGGICPLTGDYMTKGKRSPIWNDGSVYYEGLGNRQIVKGIAKQLEELEIPYKVLVPEYKDCPLWERVQRIKKLKTNLKKIVVSVHSNGFHKGTASGWEVFTSHGNTESDRVADVFLKQAKEQLGDRFRMRGAKEANFYMLQNHPFTAILTENLFHTNERECAFLMSEKGQQEIIDLHVKAIVEYERL